MKVNPELFLFPVGFKPEAAEDHFTTMKTRGKSEVDRSFLNFSQTGARIWRLATWASTDWISGTCCQESWQRQKVKTIVFQKKKKRLLLWVVDYKNLHNCDNSTLKHLNLHMAFRDFIANFTKNNEKPSQAALENVTAPTMAHSLINISWISSVCLDLYNKNDKTLCLVWAGPSKALPKRAAVYAVQTNCTVLERPGVSVWPNSCTRC